MQPVSQRLSGCTHQPQSMDCQSQLRAATEPASNVQPLSLTPKTQTAKDDPDCKAFPMYNEHGLGDGASYGGKAPRKLGWNGKFTTVPTG